LCVPVVFMGRHRGDAGTQKRKALCGAEHCLPEAVLVSPHLDP